MEGDEQITAAVPAHPRIWCCWLLLPLFASSSLSLFLHLFFFSSSFLFIHPILSYLFLYSILFLFLCRSSANSFLPYSSLLKNAIEVAAGCLQPVHIHIHIHLYIYI